MDYPITPLAFTEVTFDDRFWLPRLTTNREVTIPYDFRKCEDRPAASTTSPRPPGGWRGRTRESFSTTPTCSRWSKGPPTR